MTTQLLLVLRSWKSRSISLPTLWATTGPVKGTLYLCLYHGGDTESYTELECGALATCVV